MDGIYSERNDNVIAEFVELLSSRKNSRKGKIIIFAGAAISMHAPSCLPIANQMLEETIEMLFEDNVLKATFQKASIFDQLKKFIFPCLHSRVVPPEMIYGAIYESAGNKVFAALDCLKSNNPNINHKILATLLDKEFVDYIITTNFDNLIEQSLPKQSLSSIGTHIWKIHGDIHKPHTVATTMRRIGQAAFDENLVSKLRGILEGSRVLFIGYSGADPDLMPAFITAQIKSAYWCVYKSEELNPEEKTSLINKNPCKTIQNNKIPIRWIIGDLQKEVLLPIAYKLKILPKNFKTENAYFEEDRSPLTKSIDKWKHNFFKRLSSIEKARSILQILYDIALYSSEPIDAWVLLIETANALAEDSALINNKYPKFERDLHAFQAEAYLKIAEFIEQLDNHLTTSPVVDNLGELGVSQFNDVKNKLGQLPFKINGSTPHEQVGQLFVHAKNHLTTILPLDFQDAVQIQAMLNISTILATLASSSNNSDDERRDLQGAEEILKLGLRICNSGDVNPDQGNLLEARCRANLAVVYIRQGNPVEGSHLLGQAERLFRKAGDLYGYIVTCIDISLLYKDVYSRSKDEIYIKEAWKYYKSASDLLASFPNNNLNDKVDELRELLQGF